MRRVPLTADDQSQHKLVDAGVRRSSSAARPRCDELAGSHVSNSWQGGVLALPLGWLLASIAEATRVAFGLDVWRGRRGTCELGTAHRSSAAFAIHARELHDRGELEVLALVGGGELGGGDRGLCEHLRFGGFQCVVERAVHRDVACASAATLFVRARTIRWIR